MRLSAIPFRHLAAPAVLISAALIAGCAATVQSRDAAQPPAAAPGATVSVAEPATSPAALAEQIPTVRYGRYTLIELVPEPAQRDLLRQVVEVVIPPGLDATVGDAMGHVLRRSGYRLCDTEDAAALYALPLPAAHLRLGPLMLRDALLTLAGPAWDLSVDDGARRVCFTRDAATDTNTPDAARRAASIPADSGHTGQATTEEGQP